VNLIIVPFRAPKSTKLYQQLWEKEGSPLLTNAIRLREKLAKKMGNEYSVFMAMRYGNPSIKKALNEMDKGDFEELIILPLFPQYAESTTETAIQAVYKEAMNYPSFPKIKEIKQFYDHPEFLNAFRELRCCPIFPVPRSEFRDCDMRFGLSSVQHPIPSSKEGLYAYSDLDHESMYRQEFQY